MSTKAKTETVLIGDAGGMRSEPVGRAQPAGVAPSFGIELSPEVRDRLADEVIDELLAGARTEEEIVGPGGVLVQLTKRLVEREQVARDLKPIYTAIDADAAQAALEDFDDKWGSRFPVITQAWLNAWEYVTPFLAFPPELRRVVYTTNAIEALNRQLRKAIKTKGHFPNEEAARKLIYLAIVNAVPAWTRTRNWTTALLAFKIHFGDRLPE